MQIMNERKNIWMRTYVADAYTTNGGSTKLFAVDDGAKNQQTIYVLDDCQVSMHKDRTNEGAAWEM
jgi:hypothetical protein